MWQGQLILIKIYIYINIENCDKTGHVNINWGYLYSALPCKYHAQSPYQVIIPAGLCRSTYIFSNSHLHYILNLYSRYTACTYFNSLIFRPLISIKICDRWLCSTNGYIFLKFDIACQLSKYIYPFKYIF